MRNKIRNDIVEKMLGSKDFTKGEIVNFELINGVVQKGTIEGKRNKKYIINNFIGQQYIVNPKKISY